MRKVRLHIDSGIVHALIYWLCTLLVVSPAIAQLQSQSIPYLRNIVWTKEGDIVIINYDLIGPAAKEYVVRVFLRDESNPARRDLLTDVTGHVGQGMFAGVQREIRWEYARAFPEGLFGGSYYFEITADLVPEPSSSWWYYALGGLGLLAGGAAYLLLKNAPDDQVAQSLPNPPDRP